MIASVTNDLNAVVTVLDEQRHDLEDDACITFTEVKGMTELNGKAFHIKVLGLC